MKLNDLFKGKTIREIETNNRDEVKFIFTDDSKLYMEVDGSEGGWLNIGFDVRIKGSL